MNCFEYEALPALTYNNTKYVLMDRNLWARIAWDGSNLVWDYYGYYYQWWNNWWFSDKTIRWNVWKVLSTDIPSNYVSSIWSTNSSWNSNDNLWWWTSSIVSDRQWPCPSWWHVPSYLEWRYIRYSWCTLNWDEEQCSKWQEFKKDLKMPAAGFRKCETLGFNNSDEGKYWSSSSTSSTFPRFVRIISNGISPDSTASRGDGLSVRCLMNDPKTLTFNLNGWTWVNEINVPSWTKATAPANPTNGDKTFAGWYTSTDSGTTL